MKLYRDKYTVWFQLWPGKYRASWVWYRPWHIVVDYNKFRIPYGVEVVR